MPFGHNCEFKDFAACVKKTGSDRICGALMRDTEHKCRQKRAALGRAMKYEHIVQAMCDSSWAIMPSKLQAMIEFIQLKVEGINLSPEKIADLTTNQPPLQARILDTSINPSNKSTTADKVAILPMHGTIAHRMNMMNSISGGVSTEAVGNQFNALANNPDISTIILDFDSPGGSTSGVEELGNQIFDARDKVHIVASANSLAASAAYWLGSQAHEFVITPSGEVGSIGVIAVHESIFKAKEKEGRDITIIKAGKFKADTSPLEPLSEEAHASIQERVDERYDAFVSAVSRGRDVSIHTVVDRFGEGRVVGAKSALSKGMVDKIETLDETIARFVGMPESSNESINPVIEKEDSNVGFDINTLDEEAQNHIKGLENRIHDLETQTSDESSPQISDEVMSTLPDEVRVELAAARARADEAVAKAEAAEVMAAIEKESRVKRELQDKAKRLYSSLPGTVEEKGYMLGAIESLSVSEQDSIKVRLSAGNKAIETLMASEVGETTHAAGSTYGKIESLANELMQTEDITKAQAIRKISKSHESLYAEYVAENRQSFKQ
jgi:signal peptide peptidase SppA